MTMTMIATADSDEAMTVVELWTVTKTMIVMMTTATHEDNHDDDVENNGVDAIFIFAIARCMCTYVVCMRLCTVHNLGTGSAPRAVDLMRPTVQCAVGPGAIHL